MAPPGSEGRRWEVTARSQLTARLLALQVAAVLTLPFDVVKTQRQIELGDSEVHPGEEPGWGRVPGGQPGLCCGTWASLDPHPLPSPRSRSLQAFLHVAPHATHPRRVWHPGAVCR